MVQPPSWVRCDGGGGGDYDDDDDDDGGETDDDDNHDDVDDVDDDTGCNVYSRCHWEEPAIETVRTGKR